MKRFIGVTSLVGVVIAIAHLNSVGFAGPTTKPAWGIEAPPPTPEERLAKLESRVASLEQTIKQYERDRMITPRLIGK